MIGRPHYIKKKTWDKFSEREKELLTEASIESDKLIYLYVNCPEDNPFLDNRRVK